MDKNIINIQGKLYQIIRKFKETSINLNKYKDSVSLLKQYYHCDTILKKDHLLYFCDEIKEPEYVEQR